MKRREVKTSMEGYLREVLEDFPEEITGRAKTPAATHIFKVHIEEGQVFLDEPRARAFHHYISQLMFTSTRCRKDIQKEVAFEIIHLKSPDENDWKKLHQLLPFVKCIIWLPLIWSADNLNIIKWWVYAYYTEHDGMCGHTGANTSLGRGSVLSISKNQKLYLMSSNKAGLIGADDALPQMLWTKCFIES